MEEELKSALSKTKFKSTSNTKMYFYGTQKEATEFCNELKRCCKTSGNEGNS